MPGVVFYLWVPVAFYPALSLGVQKKLKEKYGLRKGSNITLANTFRQKMLEMLEVKDERELLKKYPRIRNSINKNIKQEILEELGIEPREFSQISKTWVEEMLK